MNERNARVSDARGEIRAAWLVRVRWGACLGQAFSVLVARYTFGAGFPVVPVLSIVAVLGVTNVVFQWTVGHRRHLSPPSLFGVLAFDIAQLTALLAAVGGPSNPFSVFYLVEVAVAALIVGSRWTWALAGLAVSAYATLFAVAPPAAADHTGEAFASHLRAMWIALTAAVGLTAYFVARLSTEVERREAELEVTRERAARHERVAALTTLAAGAAHELGTPLSTVAVAAGELERSVDSLPEAESIREDVRLIRRELQRARAILDRMSSEAGATVGELPVVATAREIALGVGELLSPEEAARVAVDHSRAAGTVALVPRRALANCIHALVRNALDASPDGQPVQLALAAGDGAAPARTVLRIAVCDHGSGMTPEVLARAGDPFFTTRPPGQGLGLGLYLARTLAERLGGRLVIESPPGRGTSVTIEIPTADDSPRGGAQ